MEDRTIATIRANAQRWQQQARELEDALAGASPEELQFSGLPLPQERVFGLRPPARDPEQGAEELAA
jgi:hypothetical protein